MSHPPDPRQAAFAGSRTDGSPVQRPLSPHLQAYDMLQMTSAMSVMHRATGIAWSAATLLLVWWLVALASGPGPFATVQWFMSSFIGLLVLFGMTVVAWFHTLAGIRHMVWDLGYGFSLPVAMKSGQAVLAGTAVLTILTWVIALVVWL